MAPPDDRPHDIFPDQGWVEYRRLVLGELERLGKRIEDHIQRAEQADASLAQRIDTLQNVQLSDVRLDMADLKARSGIFGGLMGALTGAAAAIGSMLMNKH